MPPVAPPLAVADAESGPPVIEIPASAPILEPAPMVEPAVDENALATYLDGLHALPVRCPHHDSIELAVDAEGGIQVLGMIDSLPELLAVEAWVQSHADLLAMACRESSIRSDASPMVHVFAESVEALSTLHGTAIQLHLLVTVEVGPHRARHATPLS